MKEKSNKWLFGALLGIGLLLGYVVANFLPFPRPTPNVPVEESNIVAEVILEPRNLTDDNTFQGRFHVTARLSNEGREDLRDLLIVADQIHGLAGYSASPPASERKIQYIAVLPAGKQISVRFTDYATFHPDEKQEVVVSVLGHPGVRKAIYQASLPPELE